MRWQRSTATEEKEGASVRAESIEDVADVESTTIRAAIDAGDADTFGAEQADRADDSDPIAGRKRLRRRVFGPRTARALVFVVLPLVAVLLGAAVGYLRWMDMSNRAGEESGPAAVRAASDAAVAMLSYTPASVDGDLVAARDRLTGGFRDTYTSLTDDVVIPGAKQKQITSVATVPAASLVSASSDRAVVLLFVNQTTTFGGEIPSDSASTVRLSLDRIGDRWLVSDFQPI
jgi:Mce-associated membrane protein